MVGALDSGSSGPGSGPGRGHMCCVLGQNTSLSRCLSTARCINGYRRKCRFMLNVASCHRNRDKLRLYGLLGS